MTLKCFFLVWILIVIIPIGIMNVVSSEEPWSKEIKLYENAGLGDLEVFQDTLFVVGSNDKGELFYKVYNGTRWSNMIQITFDDFPDVHPDVAVFNDRLYMTWHSKRDGQYAWDIYLMTFDGMDWTTPQRLTNNPGVDDHSSLTSYNGKLWLFWTSDMEGSFGIYYMIFNGSEWSSPRRLADGLHPSSAVFRDKLYVAWYSGAYVYIKFYDGYSWSEEIPVATEWAMATTGLGVFNDTLYLLYASDRDGNWELYYKTFNGICWSDNVRVTYNPAKDGWGHLVSYQNRAYLMWQRMTDSHTEVFYKTSTFAPSPHTWWDSKWRFRREVLIIERSNYSLTNFPIEVTFEHDGNIKPNGTDIRVIDNDIEIPYYIQNINGSHVTIIFQISITASSTKSIYIYYGNPDALEPNYPLVPLTISEGQKEGYAIIDNRIYIGWNYTEWGVKSGWYIVGGNLVYIDNNPVVLWTDFKLDFDGNGYFDDEEDLITDIESWKGGIGRFHMEAERFVERSYGLGNYQGFLQTPIFVDLFFADCTLRVYKGYNFVETTQADRLVMYGSLWDYAKYSKGTEENIIDGENTLPNIWNILYNSSTNPEWMAFRNSLNGYIFGAIGFNINQGYIYHFSAKEYHAWDRCILFDYTTQQSLDPHNQPQKCKIYWYADCSNGYSEINKTATILRNPPTTCVLSEEIIPEFPSPVVLMLFILVSLTATNVLKRKRKPKAQPIP